MPPDHDQSRARQLKSEQAALRTQPGPIQSVEASGSQLAKVDKSREGAHGLQPATQQTWRPSRHTPSNHHSRRLDGTMQKRRGLGGLLGRLGHRLLDHKPSSSKPTSRGRYRKSELGRHAKEDKMPPWLVSLLQEEGEIRSSGILPVLQQLLRLNQVTQRAYLCDSNVQHVSKLKKEGGFCGYRNIQMLASYMIAAGSDGHESFHGKLPTVLEIQEYIEAAWDSGINPLGRLETGGIKGTRKYIGTAEAQAMFKGLAIPCTAHAYMHRESGKSETQLLRDIEEYFRSGTALLPDAEQGAKVVCTRLPPVYFQHRGHSMTIIGLEKQEDGSANLLVFDPSRDDPPALRQLVGQIINDHGHPDQAISPYRRGHKYLSRYKEFETLRLKHTTSQPLKEPPL
ncbi:peptidase family C78-domain-containing protein [Plectosphaerella plurivora]|uniref:Peptidase family C78-domain-containing protein n=1 Tax=Plectosphaerella plurivora TaxID=936078 RepID=A0A9P9AA69_9PEZI|nr:peptidase family C78-domain-containing protein [Plectosphaerella plurivora]